MYRVGNGNVKISNLVIYNNCSIPTADANLVFMMAFYAI